MSGSLARAWNDLLVSTAIDLSKPQVLVGKAERQESKQRASHRRRAWDHLTAAVWTFHVDPLQQASMIVICPVAQVKREIARYPVSLSFFHLREKEGAPARGEGENGTADVRRMQTLGQDAAWLLHAIVRDPADPPRHLLTHPIRAFVSE
jgi:hypothetical protein